MDSGLRLIQKGGSSFPFLQLGTFQLSFQGQIIDLHLCFFKQMLHAQLFLTCKVCGDA